MLGYMCASHVESRKLCDSFTQVRAACLCWESSGRPGQSHSCWFKQGPSSKPLLLPVLQCIFHTGEGRLQKRFSSPHSPAHLCTGC